jgi:hypothetical protein
VAWEKRGGSQHEYYTRSRKVAGRVVREYVGRGLLAEGAELRDQCRRWRAQEEREAREAERGPVEMALSILGQYDAAVDTVLKAVLYASGLHSPNRSMVKWRKRRASR